MSLDQATFYATICVMGFQVGLTALVGLGIYALVKGLDDRRFLVGLIVFVLVAVAIWTPGYFLFFDSPLAHIFGGPAQ